jgi:(S)-sulfolactate dehydrogenase
MKIVITEFMDDAAVATLKPAFDVHYDAKLVDAPDALSSSLEDADAIIVRNRTQVNEALLAAAPKLRVVGRLGVGLDNINLPACAARGIEVIPATGANARAVAEYVIATAMMLLRGSYLSTQSVSDGKWPRTALSNGRETSGKTLGIVGFGGIGRLTAKLAQGLGMRVIATDPMLSADSAVWAETAVGFRGLDALLVEADVVSLHIPLTDQTRNLFDANRLNLMKANAVLINSARGSIVDESALATALRSGKLAGAALDVFDVEPLKAGSPLADCPNLILTPHIAGVTFESNERVSSLIADRVADYLRSQKV